MTILIQVLEQGYSRSTPWEQRKYQYVDVTHVVGMRLDGNKGVWLDMSRPGESHQLALAPNAEDAILFMLKAFDAVARCRQQGGSWMIGHDGTDYTSIGTLRFPLT
ncbi:hypothetical protein [Rhodococcus gannanensis]|uniref:Uncharacterized protein n=1 Tax=Rhodococcus gannanensis TaxID=1960308 RepID=A0ABW4P504_9NOCA